MTGRSTFKYMFKTENAVEIRILLRPGGTNNSSWLKAIGRAKHSLYVCTHFKTHSKHNISCHEKGNHWNLHQKEITQNPLITKQVMYVNLHLFCIMYCMTLRDKRRIYSQCFSPVRMIYETQLRKTLLSKRPGKMHLGYHAANGTRTPGGHQPC